MAACFPLKKRLKVAQLVPTLYSQGGLSVESPSQERVVFLDLPSSVVIGICCPQIFARQPVDE